MIGLSFQLISSEKEKNKERIFFENWNLAKTSGSLRGKKSFALKVFLGGKLLKSFKEAETEDPCCHNGVE